MYKVQDETVLHLIFCEKYTIITLYMFVITVHDGNMTV